MRRVARAPRSIRGHLLLLALGLGAAVITLAALEDGLYLALGERRYVVLHTIAELASTLVSFAVFIVNWESSKQNRNAQSMVVAAGFLTVAAVDLMHVLSAAGMPDFLTPNGVEKATYFWVFARLWCAGVLVTAAFVSAESSSGWFSRHVQVALNIIAIVLVFLVVILRQSALPALYVGGLRATPLNTGLEYVIIALGLVALALYARRFRATGDEAFILLVFAAGLAAVSELLFAVYADPNDDHNLLGHLLKTVAYYLVFRALLVSSVERPYAQLRQAKASLERTVAELDERTRELDALDDVAVTLSSSLKPNELHPAAVDKVMAVMQAEAGALFLADDDDSDRMRLEAWKGLKASVVALCQARPFRFTGTAAATRIGGYEGSVYSAAIASAGGSLARIAPLRRCMCAPVSTKGRLLGAVAMVAQEDRTFSQTDAELLTAVGYQLGLAIENARLYGRTDEQLREKLRELEQAERKSRFLAEASALLASSMELSSVLELVACKSAEVVGDWCAIYLLDDSEENLHLGAVYHTDPDELAIIRRVFGRRTIRLGEGLLGQVAARGEAELVTGERLQRVSSILRSLVESQEEAAVAFRMLPSSAIVAPMRARGRTHGVLVVMQTHSLEPLGSAELGLVAELGDRAGVAIENSKLYQESQEQRRHLEAIISQMVDGVVIADESGQIVVANAAAQKMLNGHVGALIDAQPGPEELAPGESRPHESLPLLQRALHGASFTGEEIQVAGDVGERVLSASGTSIVGDSGEVSGAVVVLRDVTAERELDKMKDEFVATVSHELRTPITAVLGYTDLLLKGVRGPLTAPQADALGAVRNAGSRLLALIEDLLDISKLEAGKQELTLDVVGVGCTVQKALAGVAVIAATRRVRLVDAVPAGLPGVMADDGQLQRILGNLLSNAIKFTPEGGSVTVSARTGDAGPRARSCQDHAGHDPRWVSILVADTGVGIPIEKQPTIWDKFQQADSSSSRTYGGTGLGLAIAKGLVELHGGRIWVESEGIPGKGSTFGFTLPAAQTTREC